MKRLVGPLLIKQNECMFIVEQGTTYRSQLGHSILPSDMKSWKGDFPSVYSILRS
jgi:hypothetical protein